MGNVIVFATVVTDFFVFLCNFEYSQHLFSFRLKLSNSNISIPNSYSRSIFSVYSCPDSNDSCDNANDYCSLQIFDVSGENLFLENVSGQTFINLSRYDSGICMLNFDCKSRIKMNNIFNDMGKFKSICFIIFNLLSVMSLAQSPDWMWVETAASSGADFGNDIATDQVGDFYTVGSFGPPSITFGSFTLTNQGYGDNFLVKYSSNGSVLWAKSSGGAQYEQVTSVKVDHAGNVIITGYFYSSSIDIDGVVLNNSGDKDIFVAKFNTNGLLLWARRFGGALLDEPRDLEVDNNDNIYLAGSFESYTLNFGIAMLVTNGDYDAFLLKMNPSGNPVWVKHAGGVDRDQAFAVTYDHHGNIYCSGSFQSPTFDFGGGALNNQGNWDLYLVKFDTSGTYNWMESFGGPGFEIARSLVSDNSGFVYMAGMFSSDTLTDGNFNLYGSGLSDIFIMKVDDFGIVQWANSTQGSNDENLYSIDINNNGEVIISGGSSSPFFTAGNDTISNMGFLDGIVSCIDANGNFKWVKSFGGNDYEECYAVTYDPNGYVYLCGRFDSPICSIGTYNLVNNGVGDYLVAKIDNNYSGLLLSKPYDEVKMFPNPFDNYSMLHWNFKNNSSANLYFYNYSGDLVKIVNDVKNGEFVCDKSFFFPGFYCVKLESDNGHIYTLKFVVE